MQDLFNRLKKLFNPDKPTEPETQPDVKKQTPWIKIGRLLRDIDVNKLLVGLVTVPVIVFFTLSGVLAWLVLFVKFVVTIYNLF